LKLALLKGIVETGTMPLQENLFQLIRPYSFGEEVLEVGAEFISHCIFTEKA